METIIFRFHINFLDLEVTRKILHGGPKVTSCFSRVKKNLLILGLKYPQLQPRSTMLVTCVHCFAKWRVILGRMGVMGAVYLDHWTFPRLTDSWVCLLNPLITPTFVCNPHLDSATLFRQVATLCPVLSGGSGRIHKMCWVLQWLAAKCLAIPLPCYFDDFVLASPPPLSDNTDASMRIMLSLLGWQSMLWR